MEGLEKYGKAKEWLGRYQRSIHGSKRLGADHQSEGTGYIRQRSINSI